MEESKIEFKTYDEIENHYNKEMVKYAETHTTDEQWVATEKIHGTNFCFICDGETTVCAKRTSLLELTDKFYNFQQTIASRYSEAAKAVFEEVKGLYEELKLVRIFGEFYGGVYPGVEGKAKAIQGGIYYSPNLEFEAFDIFVECGEKREYMQYTVAVEILERAKIPYARILFQGTLSEILKLTNEANPDKYESTIYLKHSLPKLENNTIEGFVIKEDAPQNNSRMSIKVKSSKYLEGVPMPKQEKKKAAPKPKKSVLTEEEELVVVASVVGFVTVNRFDNIYSKVNEDERTLKKIKGMLVIDAWKDFEKEGESDVVVMGKKIRGVAMKALSDAAEELITRELANK